MPNSCRRRAPLTRRALRRGAAGALTTTAIARGKALPAQEHLPGTPAPLGPAIPPEIAQAADDWPTAQGNLAGHRVSGNSAISAASIDRLDVAWRLPLTAESSYGAATATPIVIGDAVYFQDMESNVIAIDRESGARRWRRDYGRPTAGGNGVAVGYGLVFGVIGIGAEVFALRADRCVHRRDAGHTLRARRRQRGGALAMGYHGRQPVRECAAERRRRRLVSAIGR